MSRNKNYRRSQYNNYNNNDHFYNAASTPAFYQPVHHHDFHSPPPPAYFSIDPCPPQPMTMDIKDNMMAETSRNEILTRLDAHFSTISRCAETTEKLTTLLERLVSPEIISSLTDANRLYKQEGIAVFIWSSMTLSQKLSHYEIKTILDEISENVNEKFIIYDNPGIFSDQTKLEWERNFGWRFIEAPNPRAVVPALVTEYVQHQHSAARPPGKLVLVSGDGAYTELLSNFARIGGNVVAIAPEKSLSTRLRAVVHRVKGHGDILVAAGRKLVAEARKDQGGYCSSEAYLADKGSYTEFARAVQYWIDGVRARRFPLTDAEVYRILQAY